MLILFLCNAKRNKSEKTLLVLIASDPPLSITAFPDLKHSAETSDVTLGLLSYITPMTPKGIVTLEILRPLGLFQLSKILLQNLFH